MMFTLEPLPAKEGDCLLLHWKDGDKPHLAIIDGGPGRVYEDTLRKRIEEIRENRQVDQLLIDLVMVSHVDNDHIVGIKKFFRALKSEIDNQEPERPFKVRFLWHNTFNDILGDSIDKYFESFTSSFTAGVDGKPESIVVKKLAEELKAKRQAEATEAEEEAYDIGLVLAGHGEARELRDSHAFLFDRGEIAALNRPFMRSGGSTLITAELTSQEKAFEGLKVKIVGPIEAEIEALQNEFDEFITEKGLTAEAVLAAYADTSVTNLSSIVSLVKFDDKSILLTGDARGDKVLNGLTQANLFENGKLKVDILKVPHHGSARNLDTDFFEKIVADTYVFSGDGKHGNPDRELLEMLINGRGKTAKYNLVLTYDVESIDKKRKEDFEKKGKSWKAQRDALKALFKDKRTEGFKFKVSAGEPVKIDIGDEAVPW